MVSAQIGFLLCRLVTHEQLRLFPRAASNTLDAGCDVDEAAESEWTYDCLFIIHRK